MGLFDGELKNMFKLKNSRIIYLIIVLSINNLPNPTPHLVSIPLDFPDHGYFPFILFLFPGGKL